MPDMTTPSLTPYTMVTVFGDAGSHRLDFNGELVRYYTTWEGDIEVSPFGLADLLNAAYQKGLANARPVVEAAHEVRLNLATLPVEAQRAADHNGWLTKLRQALDSPFAAIKPGPLVPWSNLTDAQRADIKSGYPWSKWTDADLNAYEWGYTLLFGAPQWFPSGPPIYLISEREPPAKSFCAYRARPGYEEWVPITEWCGPDRGARLMADGFTHWLPGLNPPKSAPQS